MKFKINFLEKDLCLHRLLSAMHSHRLQQVWIDLHILCIKYTFLDKTINLFKNLEMAMDQTQNKTVDIFKNLADTFDQTQSTMTAQLFQNLEATNNGNITMNQSKLYKS